MPTGQLYTGVLYDALELASLTGPARARATRWIVVVSALYGALRLPRLRGPLPARDGHLGAGCRWRSCGGDR